MASIVVIAGATGSGKARLARVLAERLNGEIVVADSRKIYQGFDIGSAKPTPGERRIVPHHLIDVAKAHETFSATRFVELADAAIEGIVSRGCLPFVVGGNGLYIRALMHGIVPSVACDLNLRETMYQEERQNPGVLHHRLKSVDPESAQRLPKTDLVRIIRALEVVCLTKTRLSELQARHAFGTLRYRALLLAPSFPTDELYARIEKRIDRMLQEGWLLEVSQLVGAGLDETPAFQGLGYHDLLKVLKGEIPLLQARKNIIRKHKRYARNQMRFFGTFSDMIWLKTPVDLEVIVEQVEDFRKEK